MNSQISIDDISDTLLLPRGSERSLDDEDGRGLVGKGTPGTEISLSDFVGVDYVGFSSSLTAVIHPISLSIHGGQTIRYEMPDGRIFLGQETINEFPSVSGDFTAHCSNWEEVVLEIYSETNGLRIQADTFNSIQKMKSFKYYSFNAEGDLSDFRPDVEEEFIIRGRMTGNAEDVPRVTKVFDCVNSGQLGGEIRDLPQVTETLRIRERSDLTGDVAELPRVTKELHIRSSRFINGNISDLPNCEILDISNPSGDISGTFLDIPSNVRELNIENVEITGDLSELNPDTRALYVNSRHRITGDLSDLPNLTYLHYLAIISIDNITGDLSAFSKEFTELYLFNTQHITGNVLSIPIVTERLHLSGTDNITGDINDLYFGTNRIFLSGVDIKGNIDNRTFTGSQLIFGSGVSGISGTPFFTENINNVNFTGAELSTERNDRALINIAAVAVREYGNFISTGGRTSASDEAVAELESLVWNIRVDELIDNN